MMLLYCEQFFLPVYSQNRENNCVSAQPNSQIALPSYNFKKVKAKLWTEWQLEKQLLQLILRGIHFVLI